MKYKSTKLALYHFSDYRLLSFTNQIAYNEKIIDEEEFLRNIPIDKVDTSTIVKYPWVFNNAKSKLHPQKLAEAGFFFTPTAKIKDLVTCYMCQCQVDSWDNGDDPLKYHIEEAPKCHLVVSKLQFANKIASNSIPFTSESYFVSRLKTFRGWWPHQFKRSNCNPQELAKAGFHLNASTEFRDQTECSQCQLVKKNWKTSQNPFHEHFLASPECPIVQLILSQSKLKFNSDEIFLPKIPRALKSDKISVKEEEITKMDIGFFDDISTFVKRPRRNGPITRSQANNKPESRVSESKPPPLKRTYSLRSSNRTNLHIEQPTFNLSHQTQESESKSESKSVSSKVSVQTKVSRMKKRVKSQAKPTVKTKPKSRTKSKPIVKHEVKSILLSPHQSSQPPAISNSSIYFDRPVASQSPPTFSHPSPTDVVKQLQATKTPKPPSRPTPVSPTVAGPTLFNAITTKNFISSSTQPSEFAKPELAPSVSEKRESVPPISEPDLTVQTRMNSTAPNSAHQKRRFQYRIKDSPTESQEPQSQSQPHPFHDLPPQCQINHINTPVDQEEARRNKYALKFLGMSPNFHTIPNMLPTRTLEEFDGTPQEFLEKTKQEAERIVKVSEEWEDTRTQKILDYIDNPSNHDDIERILNHMVNLLNKKNSNQQTNGKSNSNNN